MERKGLGKRISEGKKKDDLKGFELTTPGGAALTTLAIFRTNT